MSLENVVHDFLAPVKWADEQVLKQYAKLTTKWEERGRSRYSLAHICQLSSFVSSILSATSPLYSRTFSLPIVFIQGTDLARNIFEPYQKRDVCDDGTLTEPSDNLYLYKKFADCTRFPFFLVGGTLIGKGIYDLFDYWKTGNSESLQDGAFYILFGYKLFGTASSMYIKESNPKLLQKDPFWKTAYNWCKEKITEFVPQPTPQPLPISVKSMIIENYL